MTDERALIQYLDKRLDRLEKKVDTLISLEIEVGRLAGINEKVEDLMRAHWMQTGAASIVGALVSAICFIFFGK